MEFPASVYKRGSTFLWDGELFDFLDVADEEELEIALADGWVPHKPVSADAHSVEQPEPASSLPPQAPVSTPKRRGRKPKVTS